MTDTRRSTSRRGRPWDEDAIREALAEFLRGKTRWPTYDEFIAGGLKGLRDVLPRFGGPERWAREMELEEGPRPWGGVRRWTDAAIRAALTQLFAGRSVWPTNREFRRAGLGGLYEKLVEEGSVERWAVELGVSPPRLRVRSVRERAAPKPHSPRSGAWRRRLWTDERIADELAEFLGARTEWPAYSEFVAADRTRLYKAVLNHGGTHEWARRMNVQLVSRRGHPTLDWTEERIRQRLTPLLRGRTTWPAASEFQASGERDLLAATRRIRGVDHWAAEFNVTCDGNSVSETENGRVWTDEGIHDAILPLLTELGRWPSKREFRDAGLLPALTAVYYHGGSSRWKQRLGIVRGHSDGELVAVGADQTNPPGGSPTQVRQER